METPVFKLAFLKVFIIQEFQEIVLETTVWNINIEMVEEIKKFILCSRKHNNQQFHSFKDGKIEWEFKKRVTRALFHKS